MIERAGPGGRRKKPDGFQLKVPAHGERTKITEFSLEKGALPPRLISGRITP